MKKILSPIKGFVGVLVGATLGGEAIRQVGNVGSMPSGIRSATQSFIGLGVMGHAASTAKKLFKW